MPEEALEYSIAAEDVDTVARLVQSQWLPTYRQGRFTTLQRWLRWLDDRDASRNTRWSRCGPRFSPRKRGGRSRPSDGPTLSIAGSTGRGTAR